MSDASLNARVSRQEMRRGAGGPSEECQCEEVLVTVDSRGNPICDRCGGRIPEGAKIEMPPGTVPPPMADERS
jgi:hypothetical protein